MRKNLVAVVLMTLLLIAGCTQQPAETPAPILPPPTYPPTETPSPTPPSEPELLKVVGQIGGPTKAIAVQGDYAYVGTGIRLEVLDVSDPASRLVVGATKPFGGEVRDIVVADDYAYVATAGGGLNIVNISDPVQATVQGVYNTPGYTESVTVAGHYAYLADGPNGLSIVDISNSAKPVEIGAACELNYVFDVAIAGHFAYLAAAGAGLLVVDISNPAKPIEVGTYDTPGYAYGITISGTTLYIADGWEGLQIFDISNPAQTKIIGTYNTTGWAMDIAVVGTRLYVADAFGGLRIVDITNAARPTEIGNYTVPDGHAQSLAIIGSVAYVADIYHGVHIVDVSTPTQPQQVALYSPMGYAHAVALSDSYAYVASETYGLRVIDLVDPANPQEVANLATDGLAVTVAVSGNTAYVGTFSSGSSQFAFSLYAVDISDPLHPEASSPMPLIGHKGNQTFEGKDIFPEKDTCYMVSRSLCCQGHILYNAGEWGVLLMDISNPLAPCEISFLQTTASVPGSPVVTAVAVHGNLAYLAASGGGLYIIDISDARNPNLVGVFDEPVVLHPAGKKYPKGVNVTDVAVAPPFAYILDLDLVRVLDVSDPGHPKSLASFALPSVPFNNGGGAAQSLAIDEDTLFVADGTAGLFLVDIANPTNPQLVEQLRLPGQASWVTLDGNYVYVADGKGGLYVIERFQNAISTEETSATHDVPTTADYTSLSTSSVLTYQPTMLGLNTNNNTLANVSIAAQPQIESASNSAVFENAPDATGDSAAIALVVTSTIDNGSGSLRECLEQARNGDTIIFDPKVFPPQSPATIHLTSGLHLGKDGITIDGSNSGVILDGSSAHRGSSGFNILSNDNVIKGLQILHFSNCGIALSGNNNIIGGDKSHGNGPMGEGNLISGNGQVEIGAKQCSGNLIIGNYIGTDISGRSKLGNPQYWTISFEAASSNNRIENNVIAGSILFNDPGTSYNEVVGNYIGTDATGIVALCDDANVAVSLPFNRIGGTGAGEGNVINGSVNIARTSDVLLLGNFIGTDASGKKTFGTTGCVVNLECGSRHNFIGGTTGAERNVINGSNEGSSLIHLGGCADYNFVAGNYLGLDAAGSVTMSNGSGISLEVAEHNSIQGNFISGSQTAMKLATWDNSGPNFNCLRANRIMHSEQLGIAVASGRSNLIIWNSLFNNHHNGYDNSSDNLWDDGKEGNYWDDYIGKDKNSDGIGDMPYSISPNGVDNYPLMKPYGQ